MRTSSCRILLVVGSIALLSMSVALTHAVELPRQEYLRYLPLGHPRLVQQTPESVALHLFGDRNAPAYRDVDPVDGIDDARHAVLMDLAVRFAPYLVQNTSNIPTNIDCFIDNVERFPLYVDIWNVSADPAQLQHTREINFSALGGAACASSNATEHAHTATNDAATEDCKLLQLLEEFSPVGTVSTTAQPHVRPRPEYASVLFFDFPGEGPGTWKQAYEPEYNRTPVDRRNGFAHSYVHPFLTSVRDSAGVVLGYDLVLQYWFFYPSNDGGNNHEGDWEHLNVAIAPLSMVGQPLSAANINDILDGTWDRTDNAADPLVMRRVEYYFHHFVMSLDLSNPNVYLPRAEWEERVRGHSHFRFRENELWNFMRNMAWIDKKETRINTHPIGYIGADNKGFDQVLSAPGGKNRNSHGTFPFPGRYHNIGPAGATEQISLYLDPKALWKRVDAQRGTQPPSFERGKVLGLADRERLRIVPDWERVVDLVRNDTQARRDWSWLLLPIRWGYPATESPLAGILPHSDTGNLAPHGPTFSNGWNVSGPAPGFHNYEPNTLPAVFPLRMQDGFRNDFGFFNLTLPLLFNLPPLDFLSRLGAYPFKLAFSRRDPVYYPKENVPFRFVGLSSGVSTQILSESFQSLALSPDQFDEFLLRLVGHLAESGADSTTTTTSASDFLDHSVQPFYQVLFYLGDRFSSENTVRNVRANMGFEATFNNIPPYRYGAVIDYWEYAGSLRYSILTSRLQPYVKGGYGWSWYRLKDVQANGVPFTPEDSEWIKPKNIWPNVWHVGVGGEFIPWKRSGTFPGGTDLSFRFEYGYYMENLGLDLSGLSLRTLAIVFPTLADVPNGERVSRHDLLFGIAVTF